MRCGSKCARAKGLKVCTYERAHTNNASYTFTTIAQFLQPPQHKTSESCRRCSHGRLLLMGIERAALPVKWLTHKTPVNGRTAAHGTQSSVTKQQQRASDFRSHHHRSLRRRCITLDSLHQRLLSSPVLNLKYRHTHSSCFAADVTYI